jgi:aspartate carbamoyltransferase catalytic subunit
MSEELYKKVKGSYIVDKRLLAKMKKNAIIMHCLPRIDEIAREIDDDPRCLYFDSQVRNGMYLRMALLESILRK